MNFSAGPPTSRRGDGPILSSLLTFALSRASAFGEASFQAAVSEKGVTRLRYAFLEIVSSAPGLQQVQIADSLSLSRPAITLLADYWERRGIIDRRRDPADRRSVAVFLSPGGEAYLGNLRQKVRAHDRSLTRVLNSRERAELETLLAKISGQTG